MTFVEVDSTHAEAWGAIADAGGVAVVLAIGITVVWRWSVKLLERLLGDQAKATEKLAEAVHKVELAVTRSDERNVAALAALRASHDRHEGRLDKHEATLAEHASRIRALEAGQPPAQPVRTWSPHD